jgi:hypothetical protein
MKIMKTSAKSNAKKAAKKVAKKTAKKSAKSLAAKAIHVQQDKVHLVGVEALRVLLVKDGDGWFAQGLEIDYAAAGSTVEEAKKNFETGLELTVHEHLRVHGTISRFLTVAPPDAWQEFFALKTSDACLKQSFTTVQIHQLDSADEEICAPQRLPFDRIAFIEPEHAMAA